MFADRVLVIVRIIAIITRIVRLVPSTILNNPK